ncbi:unnamed protein product [Closterium sp. Naga37s-1]|nr:unnamed protein product [Closterium sp. Naga37s-1]
MRCPDTAPMLRHHFCFFHIDAPGHQDGARHLRGSASHGTAQDMADQVADVINALGLMDVTCMGVTAGAYILTLLAVRSPRLTSHRTPPLLLLASFPPSAFHACLRHPCLVRSLILISPLCRPPSWAEWGASKVNHFLRPLRTPTPRATRALQVLVSSLSLVGAASAIASAALMQRYVPLAQRAKPNQRPSIPQLSAIQEGMRGMAADGMVQYIRIMDQRKDLTGQLAGMRCPCLVVVGEMSPFRDDALHLHAHLPRRLAAWFQVPAPFAMPCCVHA